MTCKNKKYLLVNQDSKVTVYDSLENMYNSVCHPLDSYYVIDDDTPIVVTFPEFHEAIFITDLLDRRNYVQNPIPYEILRSRGLVFHEGP